MRTPPRRARCTRSSTAASTGTPACTATGCWPRCGGRSGRRGGGADRGPVRRHADEEKVAGELAYLQRPSSRGFERPYGWAWLLALAVALKPEPRWSAALRPLAQAFAARFKAFLPGADYPIRTGSHANTAFALHLALGYAQAFEDADLLAAIRERAVIWYAGDRAAPAWEPSGDDFLSPTLTEAQLMANPQVSGAGARDWLAAFLPELRAGQPAALFQPVRVSDRSDGKIAHLDGLNLSRAWAWRELAQWLEPQAAALARDAAERHLAASLPHVAGDYMGEHWLATYAVLALPTP